MNETKSNQKSPHTEKKLKSEKISTKLTPKKRRNSSTDKRIETKRKVTPKKLDSERLRSFQILTSFQYVATFD
jgi:hypothetical protein